MKRVHLRHLGFGLLAFGIPSGLLAATFQGPASQPPSGNAPGVIWNMKDNPTQTQSGAVINVPGLRTEPTNKDVYLESGKAFRVEGSNSTSYQFGNWYLGTQKALTTYFNGDIQASPIPGGTGFQGQRGRVQATEFCFNPGTGPSDCISDWGSAGGGADYVLKAGDTMTGPLSINRFPSGAFSPTYNLASSIAPAAGSSFNVLSGIVSSVNAPASSLSSATIWGINGGASANAAGSSMGNLGGISGTASVGNGATVISSMGGYFLAGANAGANISKAVGAKGTFNTANEFGTIGEAIGMEATAVNGAPTKSVGNLIGLGVSASGRASNYLAGINSIVGSNVTGPAAQVGIDTSINQNGGKATNLYGLRSVILKPGGSSAQGATNAYGLYASVGSSYASTTYGVYGDSGTFTNGTGLFGNGYVGVEGDGYNTGVVGSGNTYGGYFTGGGSGSTVGVYGWGTTNGIIGAGTAQAGGIGGNFTGSAYGVRAIGTASLVNNATGIYAQSMGSAGTAGKFAGATGVDSAATGLAGTFVNTGSLNRTDLGSASYALETTGPVNFKTSGNSQMFYINNNGEVHANGAPYAGFYFHDRSNLANRWFTWYSDASQARLYNNSIGDVIKVNYTNGQIFNYAGSASWNTSSDERLKDIHGEYTKGLEVLSLINPITFNYKKDNPQNLDSSKTHEGVSAQELIKVLPEAVQLNQDGYLTVNNDPILWVSVNSIKQLKVENDGLKAKVQSLEERLEKLEAKIK